MHYFLNSKTFCKVFFFFLSLFGKQLKINLFCFFHYRYNDFRYFLFIGKGYKGSKDYRYLPNFRNRN